MVCDPLGDFRAWQGRLERLALHHTEPWAPPIDVHEIPDAYVLTVEVPGLKRDDIELVVEASRLTVRGQRIERRPAGDPVLYHQVERGHGVFSRTFEFAEPIDAGGVRAELADGVLTISLPKAPAPPARRIDVR
jgi:HSP20 family protein